MYTVLTLRDGLLLEKGRNVEHPTASCGQEDNSYISCVKSCFALSLPVGCLFIPHISMDFPITFLTAKRWFVFFPSRFVALEYLNWANLNLSVCTWTPCSYSSMFLNVPRKYCFQANTTDFPVARSKI